jgi:hypothetical protein
MAIHAATNPLLDAVPVLAPMSIPVPNKANIRQGGAQSTPRRDLGIAVGSQET